MIKFCDLNYPLVRKACYTKRPVLMTASNPQWTFGGGIDAVFEEKYPHLVSFKKMHNGGMERIGNIIFAITVNNYYRATPETIKKALEFAIDNTYDGETLLVSGIGTGIGGLSIDDFISVLKQVHEK